MTHLRETRIDLLITVFQKEKACSENSIILFEEHEEKTRG